MQPFQLVSHNPEEEEIQQRAAAARARGWKEEDIQRFTMIDRYQRQAQRAAAQQQALQQSQATEGKKKRSGITSWLPTIGATAAGLVAAPFTGGASLIPTLAILGGAGLVGGAAGELGAQLGNKEDINLGSIAKEGTLSGAFSAIPFGKALGVGGKLLRGDTSAIKAALARRSGKTVAENVVPDVIQPTAAGPRRVPITQESSTFIAKPTRSVASFTGVNPRVGQIQQAYEKMLQGGYAPNGIIKNTIKSQGVPMRSAEYEKAFKTLSDDYDRAVAGASGKANLRSGNWQDARIGKLGAIDEQYRQKLEALNTKFNTPIQKAELPVVQMQGSKTRLPFTQKGETTISPGGPMEPIPREVNPSPGQPFDIENAIQPPAEASSRASRFGFAQPTLGTERRTAAGRLLQRGSDDVAIRSFRLTPSQTTNFAKKHGEDVSSFLKRHKAVGMAPEDVAPKIIEPLQNKFDDAVAKVNQPIGFNDYASAVQRRADRLLKSPATDDNAVGMNLIEELKNAAEKQGAGFKNGQELTKFRRSFDAQVNYNMKQANPAKYTVNKHMADAAREVMEERSPGIKHIGLELSKARDFNDVAFTQTGLGRGSGLVRMIPAIGMGGVGTAVGGVAGGGAGAALGYGAIQALNSRAGQRVISGGLQKAANFADNPFVSNLATNFGRQAGGRIATNILTGNQQDQSSMGMPQQPGFTPQFDPNPGNPDDQMVMQQLAASGITDPQQIADVLYGGDQGQAGLESQVGGFQGEGQANPTGLQYSSAELFNAAIQMGQQGNTKGASEAMQMASFAKQYEDSIYERNGPAKPTKLSSAAQKQVLAITNAGTVVDRLEKAFSDVGGGQGRIGGTLSTIAGKAGLNNKVDFFNQIRDAATAQIARALGEVGTLTDQDIKRAVGNIPKVSDTPEVAKMKIQSLKEMLGTMVQNAYSAPTTNEMDINDPFAQQSTAGMDVNNAFAY